MKGVEMDETESVGFNKKRAEGRDQIYRPLQLKAKKLNPVNTISYVQILGTGMDTQDTSPSVLLFFDNQRIIFNAGEGFQRFCTEHKIKLSKLDHIFLSRICSETVGGLPGLLLTLAGVGEEGMSVNIWGPSDINYLVDAMRFFIPNSAMVHTRSFGPPSSLDAVSLPDLSKFTDPIVLIDDEVVKLSVILLQPNCSDGSQVFTNRPGAVSVIYICELPEIKGKFDPAKAVALGLKAGPKYRELQLGNSVKSECKNIMVHPSDVMGPSIPGPIVILIDCPTESHLQGLISLKSLGSYYSDFSSNPPKTVNCIIHLSPMSVTISPTYQEWMGRFLSAQHIMAGHEIKNVEVPILRSSARITARLNYLCPQFFPAPGFRSLNQLYNSVPESITSSEGPVSKLCESVPAENLLKFALRPYAKLGLDRSSIPSSMAPSKVIDELLSEIPEIADVVQHISQFWHGTGESNAEVTPLEDDKGIIEEPWLNENILPSCLENVRRDDLEIVLLGTGSAQPSKYRNVSSIYVNLFSKGSLLLDCGQGTLGQLKIRYGLEGADIAVKSLRCIWISHIHADHHAGLARILVLRRELLKGVPHDPLLLVGPRRLERLLNAYQRLEDLDMQFLECGHTTKADNAEDMNLQKVLKEAGLEALVSFPVVHCPQAFGVVLKAADRTNSFGKMIPGWKIVYSGDTRPCPELVEASHGATVLIHEATFEDGLIDEAIAKKHSTTSEAIEAGAFAGVYRIILTHFSQRYPKIPIFDETHMHRTSIAFDMMSVNLTDLYILPKVFSYIKLLFKSDTILNE